MVYFDLITVFQLVEPHEPLTKGKIRDSNRSTLLAVLREHNIPVIDLGIARDRLVLLVCHLAAANKKDKSSCSS